MRFKLDGKEMVIESDGIRLRELAEAEKALGMTMADGTAGAISVHLFVAMRRTGDERNPGLVADDVLNATFENIMVEEDGEGDAGPPVVDANGSPAPEFLPIIGRLPSGHSV